MNERLGEIKEKLVRWQTEEIESTNVDLWPKDIRDVEWLIEQAERVQELKARDEGRELAHKLVVHYAKETEQQNKRYREAMENVLQTMATPYWHEMKEEIVNTLLQAIEGESNE